MPNTYIGLTIGPIFDTLNLASTPAALWAGSYMFSTLTKTICEQLVTKYDIPKENIISPYYDPDEPLLNKKDGVGLFHDRIIFRVDETHPFSEDKISSLRTDAIKIIADKFMVSKDYLNEYIMVSGCRFESDNAILGSAVRLDSLELAKPYVCEDKSNALLSMLVNDGSEHANEQIKKLPIVEELDNWQLLNNKKAIRSLPDIASRDVPEKEQTMKKQTYYAIVRSDGDRMGSILQKLSSDEEVRKYSKTCLQFCSQIAEIVSDYGGITIYSGGDDLLALLPLESPSYKEAPDLFAFLKKANIVFGDFFRSLFTALNNDQGKVLFDLEKDLPTLSFGVSVCYHKFPLYEALADSGYLLFGIAKNREKDPERRNCTAIRFQKHAGQSEGLLIQNTALDSLIDLKQKIDAGVTDDSTVFLSALHKLSLFDTFYAAAENNTDVDNLFNNFFDADSHSENAFLKKVLPGAFNELRVSKEIDLLPDYRTEFLKEAGLPADCYAPLPVQVLCYLLRIFKFYKERIGEKS